MNNKGTLKLEQVSIKFTEEVLRDVVRDSTKNNHAEVISYALTCQTAPGESYLGVVYRLNVEADVNGNNVPVSLIVKGMPANVARRLTWKIPTFFRNEVLFYSHVAPILHDFECRRTEGKVEKSFLHIPICHKAYSDGENDYIVMSDLGVDGFSVAERTEGFSVAHCESALVVLASFHGVGLALKILEPETFEKMVKDIIEPYYRYDYESWYGNFLKNLQVVAIDCVVKEVPGTIYEKKMKEFADENQYKLMCKLVSAEEPYAIPCHGDTWGMNFLYQHNTDENVPSATKLIDFQLMRYSNPVLDLIFFLYSVTTNEQRDNGGYDKLLNCYHDAMTNVVSAMGADINEIFSYETFLKQVDKLGVYGLGMGIESVPLSMLSSENVSDLDGLPGDKALPLEDCWKVPLIERKDQRQRVVDLIKFTVERGYL